MTTASPEDRARTISIGQRTIHRLGYGAMRLTGPGVWGPPVDRAAAISLLRRAVELGVQFIDTADSYGPYDNEELIREALHPYADDVLIATKVGLVRTGPLQWFPLGRPEYLRQQVEMSLRRLGTERLDLLQLHQIDPQVGAEAQFGVLRELQDEGKIDQLGLSNVTVAQLELADTIMTVASIQNRYNVVERKSDDLVELCTARGIAFIPWYPIAAGRLTTEREAVDSVAADLGATHGQVCLAWLLHRSPIIVPIPGTANTQHLTENCAAADLRLSSEHLELLESLGVAEINSSWQPAGLRAAAQH